MSEQQNNMEGMNFGTGSTLEELFGATIPQVDLGDQFPAPAQTAQPQAMPVTNPPAAAPESRPAQENAGGSAYCSAQAVWPLSWEPPCLQSRTMNTGCRN